MQRSGQRNTHAILSFRWRIGRNADHCPCNNDGISEIVFPPVSLTTSAFAFLAREKIFKRSTHIHRSLCTFALIFLQFAHIALVLPGRPVDQLPHKSVCHPSLLAPETITTNYHFSNTVHCQKLFVSYLDRNGNSVQNHNINCQLCGETMLCVIVFWVSQRCAWPLLRTKKEKNRDPYAAPVEAIVKLLNIVLENCTL